jgi:UDP-N-acetylglucosamine 4,6-dehydratase/5-epimerase
MFNGKTLLITGGTGSFGNAVLKRFLHSDLKEIRIFSRDEKKQDDMRNELKSSKVKFYIGDVRDPSSLSYAMNGVDYVFHAAALKQVPSCEFYPVEALKTNSMGAENVLTAAIAAGVKKVICLSTDKAVYPINAMGISKAMMEKIAVAKSKVSDGTAIMVTRYGNVMASRGSVIPLFISQIKSGQPITITDPAMTRFMMSLEDAVDLVMYAFNNGKSGEIFVQKSPASTLDQLARVLMQLFDTQVKVHVIGTRHGEKKYETLLTREEMTKAESLEGYYRIVPDIRDLNYSKYFSEGDSHISEVEDYNSNNTHRLTDEELKELLLKLDYTQEELRNWKKQPA